MTQEKLIVILEPTDLSRPSWLVLDEHGAIRQSARFDVPEGLAAIAANKWVMVVVPPIEVLITSVTLPPLRFSQLAKAVPFALEDQLIDDIDNLHFAIGPQQPSGLVPVLIIGREKMTEWLLLMSTWQLAPDEMVPAIFTVPYRENALVAALGDQTIVRTGRYSGLSTPISLLSQVIPFALSQDHTLQSVVLYRETTLQTDVHLDVSIPVHEEVQTPEERFQMMASALSEKSFINLLQSPFLVKKPKRFDLQSRLKIMGSLAAIWILLLLFSPVVSAVMFQQASKKVNANIAAIYFKYFPKATGVMAPKERLQDKLQKMGNGLNLNKWLLVLGFLGDAAKKTPGIQIKKLDYAHQVMTVMVIADTTDHFDAFTNLLTQQGFAVKQSKAVVTANQVEALLTID